MFALVADVEKYPLFVPMCESLSIKSRKERDGRELLIADMSVGYKRIRETFTSQILLDRAALVIETKYIDGPFKYLNNQWCFTETGQDACDVHFFIDYEFKSRVLGLLMGSMFDIAFRRFTHAFETRADEVFSQG